MLFDFGKRRQGADAETAAFFFDGVEAGNGLEVDDIVRRYHPLLHELQDLAPAGHDNRALFLPLKFLQQRSRLLHAFGIDVFESFHGRSLLIRPGQPARSCPE